MKTVCRILLLVVFRAALVTQSVEGADVDGRAAALHGRISLNAQEREAEGAYLVEGKRKKAHRRGVAPPITPPASQQRVVRPWSVRRREGVDGTYL